MAYASSDKPENRFKLTLEAAERVRRDPPDILTVPETAAYMAVGLRGVWDEIAKGNLKVSRLGSRVVVRLTDIKFYLERRAS